MNFNENQTQEIYDFIMQYNSNEEYREEINKTYDNEAYRLNILYIYALEEVLRYGTKGIYLSFSSGISENFDENINLYNEYSRLLREEPNFMQYKMQKLEDSPDSLSFIERLILSLVTPEEEREQTQDQELEYDNLNPIRYSTDKQIRATLENLFLGEFIARLLETPAMKEIKDRQKPTGEIANIDKPLIIEKIQTVVLNDASVKALDQIIDQRYIKVKMAILLGKKEEAFAEYIKYNTNISSNEIFGVEEDYSEEKIMEYFKELVRQKREENKPQK